MQLVGPGQGGGASGNCQICLGWAHRKILLPPREAGRHRTIRGIKSTTKTLGGVDIHRNGSTPPKKRKTFVSRTKPGLCAKKEGFRSRLKTFFILRGRASCRPPPPPSIRCSFPSFLIWCPRAGGGRGLPTQTKPGSPYSLFHIFSGKRRDSPPSFLPLGRGRGRFRKRRRREGNKSNMKCNNGPPERKKEGGREGDREAHLLNAQIDSNNFSPRPVSL